MQARVDHRLGARNFVTAGYEFMRENYFNFNDTEISDMRTDEIALSQRSHALYAQDQAQLAGGTAPGDRRGPGCSSSTWINRTSRGRRRIPYEGNIATIDHAECLHRRSSPLRISSRTARRKLRAHGGNSYRAPSSFERFGGDLSFGATYFGDPRLRPERAVAFDVGRRSMVVQLESPGERHVLSGPTWRRRSASKARLPPDDPFGRFFGFANGSGGDANGRRTERAFLAHAANSSPGFLYARQFESDTPTFGANYFKTLGLSPHTFALSFTQWVSPRFHATFDLFAKGGYDLTMFGAANRLFQFDSTAKANLMLGYELPIGGRKGLEIYTRIENLF